ncbi:MAG: S-layer homology domain-containing protein, partial [Oscillospiraceae bacterium]|nr:S-layer homology domain-containing protein [Oscillospiraceae bacterium]
GATREQLVVMLYRYAQMKGYDVTGSAMLDGFGDAADVSAWAADAMRWAVGAGLIRGTGEGLEPQGTATRAQAAAIITRFIQFYV